MKEENLKQPEDRATERFFEKFLEGLKSGLAKYENESPEIVRDDIDVHLIVLNSFEQCRVPSRRPSDLPEERLLELGELSGNAIAALHFYALDQLRFRREGDLDAVATLDPGQLMS